MLTAGEAAGFDTPSGGDPSGNNPSGPDSPSSPEVDFSYKEATNVTLNYGAATLFDDKWCDFCKKYEMDFGSSYNATQEDLRHTENNPEGVNACFNEINAAGEANKHDFLFITDEDKREYVKTIGKYFTYWLNDKDEACFVDRYASEYIQILMTGSSHVCHNGNACLYHWLGINSNGDLYPCDRALPEKYRIGNVMDFESIEEVYHSETYELYASERNEKLDTKCSVCDTQHYCHGNCPMIDIDANGTAAKANAYACSMQKLGIVTAYNALTNTSIEKCNRFMRNFLIENCVFLPGEIMPLMKELGIEKNFEGYDFTKEISDFSSKEFKLFAAVNPPVENDWITEDYCEMYATVQLPDGREDDRVSRAKKALHERAEQLIPQFKGRSACDE